MVQHVFIGEPYYSLIDTIEFIIYGTIKQHLIFDEDNKLLYIKKLNAPNDEVAQLTINNIYEFKNGVPLPFYNYFNMYYDNLNYSLILNDKELDELMIIGDLINNISDFESNQYVHNDLLQKYKTILIGHNINKDILVHFEDFATEYNEISKIYDTPNSNNVSPNTTDEQFYVEKLDEEYSKIKNKHINNILKKLEHKFETANL